MSRTIGAAGHELPNLVLATTYALNRSNSKRVCVGLEYSDGYFYEVVKLVHSGSRNHVTLDADDWKSLRGQFGRIGGYFQDYKYQFYEDFARPEKQNLPHHDLDFTTSYGIKSITLDKRPIDKHDYTAAEEEPQGFDETPCRKKLKFDQPPGIVMQQTTFEGLRIQSVLIDHWLEVLKERVGKVNRVIDLIFEYLKGKLEKETLDSKERIFSNVACFKQFYALHNVGIEGFVNEKIIDDSDEFKSVYLRIVLSEILIYNLSYIMRDLREVVLEV